MIVEHEHISKVMNKSYNEVKVRKRYHLHTALDEEIKGLIPTLPYSLPVECLSCLNKNGSDVFLDVEKGLIGILYGEKKNNKSFYHLHGVFEGEKDGKKVTGVLMGGMRSDEFVDSPNMSDPAKIEKTIEILEEISETGIDVKGIELLRGNFS